MVSVRPAIACRAASQGGRGGWRSLGQQQRDPQRAVGRGLQPGARRTEVSQRDGPVEPYVLHAGHGALHRGVELSVVVDEVGSGLGEGLLDEALALDGQDVEPGVGAERHRARLDLQPGVQRHRDRLAALAGDADQAARRDGRLGRDAEQAEELAAVALGDLVGAVGQRLGQEREQLEQRDAGVGAVEVGLLRVVHRDPGQGLVEELLVAAGVEDRWLRGHGRSPPSPADPDVGGHGFLGAGRDQAVDDGGDRGVGVVAAASTTTLSTSIRGSHIASALTIRSWIWRRVVTVLGSNR